jgi:hypothetical protein
MPDRKAFDDQRDLITAARRKLAEIQKSDGSKSMKFWDAQEELIKLEAAHNDMVLTLHPKEQERYLASIRQEKRA